MSSIVKSKPNKSAYEKGDDGLPAVGYWFSEALHGRSDLQTRLFFGSALGDETILFFVLENWIIFSVGMCLLPLTLIVTTQDTAITVDLE